MKKEKESTDLFQPRRIRRVRRRRALLSSKPGESGDEEGGGEQRCKCLSKKPCSHHRPSHGSSSRGPAIVQYVSNLKASGYQECAITIRFKSFLVFVLLWNNCDQFSIDWKSFSSLSIIENVLLIRQFCPNTSNIFALDKFLRSTEKLPYYCLLCQYDGQFQQT